MAGDRLDGRAGGRRGGRRGAAAGRRGDGGRPGRAPRWRRAGAAGGGPSGPGRAGAGGRDRRNGGAAVWAAPAPGALREAEELGGGGGGDRLRGAGRVDRAALVWSRGEPADRPRRRGDRRGRGGALAARDRQRD